MKAEWTPSGGSLAELGNDASKIPVTLEGLSGAAAEQVEALFRGSSAVRYARGNVAGECTFQVAKSHADRATAMTYFKTEFARLNQKGSLVLTEGSSTLTMANAVLRGVELVGVTGLRWWIRYRFGIGTIT